ncbi:MAG: hypothetical protein EAZ90_27425 [Oscillatoriales cyanobacterium]|nr:MAG: hypothetical protein EAZ90_27425 [Oscillatoriales cyanobacterium]
MRCRKQGQRSHILSFFIPVGGCFCLGGRSVKSISSSKNRVNRQFPEIGGMQKNHQKTDNLKLNFCQVFPHCK